MKKSTIITISSCLALGLAGGYFIGKTSGGTSSNTEKSANKSGEREVLYWKAPMDPNFRRDSPGKSPMGMDLVPVYADQAGGNDDNLIRINPGVQNNIGVRTAQVTRMDLARNIDTIGFIKINENTTQSVDVRTEGWIEKLYVKSIGDPVKKGQPLFDLYSKPLIAAQEEFLQANRLGRDSLTRAAKGRLTALGLSNAQINAIAKSGKTKRTIRIFSPQNGIVTMIGAGEGAFVKPGREVVMLTDLSSVWVLAEVFENQAAWVKPGQSVHMRIRAEPGRIWNGTVDYVYPTINGMSRTTQVRLQFDNADGALRPKGYANIQIKTDPKTNVLAIEREALIQTGQSNRVILALGDGNFGPAEVVPGMESGGKVEIISGLNAGETIVVSGQFLIDSEASLQGTMLRMSAQEPDNTNKQANAKGVVVELMAEHGMITLEHEPIPDFGWPEMEMDFVTEPAALKGLKEGDEVEFTVLEKSNDNDDFVITKIQKADQIRQANAKGVVVEVMAEHGMITLEHEPIPDFGWPEMEMDFVTEPAALQGLKEGDTVEFTVLEKSNDNDDFVITAIKKSEDAQ